MDGNLDSLRRQAKVQGCVLLIYQALLHISVSIILLVRSFGHPIDAGYGYLLAIGMGILALLLWKRPEKVGKMLARRGRPMRASRFFACLIVLWAAQFVGQLSVLSVRWGIGRLGFSAGDVLDTLSVDIDTIPMLLYVCILGPISEELLFRGILQQTIQPYGKRLAILCSAVLFALFHGNPIQVLYAFAMGLVLAVVVSEHHVFWTMVLHMCNNLLFGVFLPWVLSALPVALADWLHWTLLLSAFVAGIAVLACKLPGLQNWLRENKLQKGQFRTFFGTATVLIFLGWSLINMLSFFVLPQLLQN